MNLWTGIACLVADPKCENFKRFGEDGKGAYVNIVAWADSQETFSQRVQNVVTELDCILLELDKTQSLDTRMQERDYPEELLTMKATAQRQPNDIIFGTFHIWMESDVN